MAIQEDLHLAELIAKFYRIGKQKYNGKVYDNVLNIFDELDIEEQKAMIRGALGVYSAATSTLIHEREIIDRGDVDAFLLYLKRAKEQESKESSQTNETKVAIDSKPSDDDGYKSRSEELADKTIVLTMVIFAIGIVLAASIHLIALSMDGSPEAMSKAKFYRSLFEIFEIKL